MVKILFGLMCGNQGEYNWAERWYNRISPLADHIVVIDNSTDGTGDFFHNKPKVTFYIKQTGLPRHNNRDYQQILDRAKQLDVDWVFNIDLDEEFDDRFSYDSLHGVFQNLSNSQTPSVEFLLFEMWEDEEHYILMGDDKDKHMRRVSKAYKVTSHLEHNQLRSHGCSIPENCLLGPTVDIKIKHFGHMTKELREQKRKMYSSDEDQDGLERTASWLNEKGQNVARWVSYKILGEIEYVT